MGESRDEFERDRMGQTGEDNAALTRRVAEAPPTSALTRYTVVACQKIGEQFTTLLMGESGRSEWFDANEPVYLASEVDAAMKESRAQFITAERLRREDGASHITEQIEHAEQVKSLRAEVARLSRDLDAWRSWAQFVYLEGGPVTKSDSELRAGVCEAHDADVADVSRERDEARAALAEKG